MQSQELTPSSSFPHFLFPALTTLAVLLLVGYAGAQQPPAGIVSTPKAAGQGIYSDSWAVVIGINEYEHPRVPDLRYAVNDARAVQQILQAQGFAPDRIVTLLDQEATKARIEAVLGDELHQKVRPNDRVFVFFAGHGQTDRLRSGEYEGYLVPVDGDPSRLFSTAISMASLRQISDRIRAKHILYVVDACYSGYAIFNRGISDELLEEMVKKPAVQILTAGRQQDEAVERGKHGVFTQVLVRGLQGGAFMEKNWLALEELGLWVKQRVWAESGKRQLPQYGNMSGEGQFVFLKPGAQAAARPPQSPRKPRVAMVPRQEFESLNKPVFSEANAQYMITIFFNDRTTDISVKAVEMLREAGFNAARVEIPSNPSSLIALSGPVPRVNSVVHFSPDATVKAEEIESLLSPLTRARRITLEERDSEKTFFSLFGPEHQYSVYLVN